MTYSIKDLFKTLQGQGDQTGRPYRPRTISTPNRIRPSCRLETFPARSVSCCLSTAVTKDSVATESFSKPVAALGKSTFPGACAHFKLLVKGTQTTVPIRLRFSASH
jgi:hypothetical protein